MRRVWSQRCHGDGTQPMPSPANQAASTSHLNVGVLNDEQIAAAIKRVRPHTMVVIDSLRLLARQVSSLLLEGVDGDFVECGAWRGGASFLMADLLRQRSMSDRKVWLFDSFQGIPEPELVDGAAAL